MSFIGPRPLMVQDLHKLKDAYPSKHNLIENWWDTRQTVLPGLSGWHQIHLVDHNTIRYDLESLLGLSPMQRMEIFVVSILIFIMGKQEYFRKEIPQTYEIRLD
jgi:lipopolysaccharide/colanic/teichoic acid biosynthesis glycosyltransferase